jgi:hypothetical protein
MHEGKVWKKFQFIHYFLFKSFHFEIISDL